MSGLSLSVPATGRPVLPGRPLRMLPDDRLARLAARGDQAAFAALYERHHQALYRYCRSLLSTDEDAQDALQSTMLKAMSSLPGDRREMRIKPWLYRVAHNESITILRGRRSTRGLEAAADVAAPSGADPELRERLRTLIADLRELPERQRGALVMRELSGLSYADIAAALDTSVAGAKQAVYEARLALNDLAEGREMDCESIRARISAEDRRLLRGRKVRGHLRGCAPCRAFEECLRARPAQLAALAPPLPAVVAAGVLQSLAAGGAGGSAAGAAAGAGVAGTAGPVAGAAGLKAALASVAVVAAGAGAVQITSHHGSGAAPVGKPAPAAQSSARGIPTHSGTLSESTGREASTAAQQRAIDPSRGGGHRVAAGQSGSGGGNASSHGHAGTASPAVASASTSNAGAAAQTPAATTAGNQASSSSGEGSSGAGESSSGTPVGPSHGHSVANSHLPTHVPPPAVPHVPSQVPAGGHGAPAGTPAGGAGVTHGQGGGPPSGGSAPGNSGSAPGNSGSAPGSVGNGGGPPGQSGSAPGHGGG